MDKKELLNYLDEFLHIKEYTDDSKNGLQVDTSKSEIKKLWYAVDATSYIFEKAKKEGVDMVFVHHWIFWWYEQTVTWIPFERISAMIKNDIALYACHLPLDAHSEVGNNIGLVKAFIRIFWLREGEYEIEPFGEYHGSTIWFWLRFKQKMHISNMVTPYGEQMQLLKKLYNFWNKDFIESVAFISGGGASCIKEAKEKNYDVFVTGEAVHYEMCLAKELKQSILLGGHRETEKIGPKLLAHHIKEKFWIETVFLDEKY